MIYLWFSILLRVISWWLWDSILWLGLLWITLGSTLNLRIVWWLCHWLRLHRLRLGIARLGCINRLGLITIHWLLPRYLHDWCWVSNLHLWLHWLHHLWLYWYVSLRLHVDYLHSISYLLGHLLHWLHMRLSLYISLFNDNFLGSMMIVWEELYLNKEFSCVVSLIV